MCQQVNSKEEEEQNKVSKLADVQMRIQAEDLFARLKEAECVQIISQRFLT